MDPITTLSLDLQKDIHNRIIVSLKGLLKLNEAALFLGVSEKTFKKIRYQFTDFPKPELLLSPNGRDTEYFKRPLLEQWLKEHSLTQIEINQALYNELKEELL